MPFSLDKCAKVMYNYWDKYKLNAAVGAAYERLTL